MSKQIKVLIVDDDPLSNFLCKEIVKLYSKSQVVTDFTMSVQALNFISALGANENQNTRIVLFLDLNMPIISGWEFLEKFEAFEEPVKKLFEIYIISSSLDPNDEKRALSFPSVRAYLVKPLTEQIMNDIFSAEKALD